MFTKIRVTENNRVILAVNDRFARLLTPGVHRIFTPPMMRVDTESHDLRSPLFKSKWAPFLIAHRPDLVSQHFVVAQTRCLEIAMILVDGSLYDVILPGKTVLLWKAAGKLTVELVDIGADDATAYRFSETELPAIPAHLSGSEDDWVFEKLDGS